VSFGFEQPFAAAGRRLNPNIQNILLIRLKSIGDVVLTLPAVNAIRDNFPNAKITFLTSLENAPLLQGFREVDEIVTLKRARFKSGNPWFILSESLSMFHRLRRGKFSLVVDFQGYGETAWLAWLSGAPKRWGSVYSTGRRWAYTRGVTRNNNMQIADWNLSLLEQCGLEKGTIRNEFILPDAALAAARSFFAAQGLDAAKPTLLIQPLTSTLKKDWPLEKYLALAMHTRAMGVQIIFGGGPADHAALEIVRQQGFLTSAGVPLLTSAGIAKLSAVVVGGVTGLLHLAVAMQKRVVMLVGCPGREPGLPYQHREWAVISPLEGQMSEIQTNAVIEACTRALTESEK
jgi:ADP-heptose:LPS heptosyltransferase